MKVLFIILIVIAFIFAGCSHAGSSGPVREENTSANKETEENDNNTQLSGEEDLDEDDDSPPVEYILDEFRKRLIQDIDEDYRVLDFNTKQELIEYISEVSDPGIAKEYVDEFYRMKDGELYIIPRDGPMLIDTNKGYTVNKISKSRYQIVQSGENELWGKYTIETTVEKTGNGWLITRIDTGN